MNSGWSIIQNALIRGEQRHCIKKNDGAYDGNENSKNHKMIVICQRVVIPVTDGLGNGLMKEI